MNLDRFFSHSQLEIPSTSESFVVHLLTAGKRVQTTDNDDDDDDVFDSLEFLYVNKLT